MLIISGLSSLLQTVTTSMLKIDPEDTSIIEAAFWLGVVSTIFSLIVTTLNSSVKIFRWDVKVNDLTSFNQRLDDFYAVVSSELQLSDKLRRDATNFIIKQHNEYLHIMQNKPEMSISEYKSAGGKFKEFLKNNSEENAWVQKYNYNDSFVTIV